MFKSLYYNNISDVNAPGERTRFRRKAERGRYDRAAIDAILDEALFCHVATIVDDSPTVIPTIHVRVGDAVYLHGSTANRVLRALASGAPACLTITLLDGLVLARSAVHHSMNYRSVVAYGTFAAVRDQREKAAISEALVEHVLAGRAREVRPPSRKELAAVLVVGMPLDEASAKVRTGPPIDAPEDLTLPVWAGVVPLTLRPAAPVPETPELELPDSVLRLRTAGSHTGPGA